MTAQVKLRFWLKFSPSERAFAPSAGVTIGCCGIDGRIAVFASTAKARPLRTAYDGQQAKSTNCCRATSAPFRVAVSPCIFRCFGDSQRAENSRV